MMKNKATICLVLIFILFNTNVIAQDTIVKHVSLKGYLTNMQSFTFQRWNEDWIADNLVHNRMNFNWHNTQNTLNAALEIRSRFISGESVKYVPGYKNFIEADNGLLSMSRNISDGKSYVLNSKIDRLYIDYSWQNLQFRLGRQRINWGQTFVWNPNDVFNSYSFFDFDYEERPGCDAARIQYYPNSTSNFEMAIKSDSSDNITAALLYRFNKWSYDVQFLGGIYDNTDYMIGTGWSGNINSAAFRGEISYFRPRDHFKDTTGILVLSVGSEYTFANSLFVQGEFLYNQLNNEKQAGFLDFYRAGLTAKKLSFTEFSLMIHTSYPVTPLLNASLSAMYFPDIDGYFIGPEIDYSLSDNVDFTITSQSFGGKLQHNTMEYFHLIFVRLKWNF